MPEALVIICYCFQHHRRTTTFFSGPKGCLTPTGVVAVKHTKHSFNPAKFLVQLSYALHVNRIGDTQKFFTLKSAHGVGIFITTFRSSPKCMWRNNIRKFSVARLLSWLSEALHFHQWHQHCTRDLHNPNIISNVLSLKIGVAKSPSIPELSLQMQHRPCQHDHDAKNVLDSSSVPVNPNSVSQCVLHALFFVVSARIDNCHDVVQNNLKSSHQVCHHHGDHH